MKEAAIVVLSYLIGCINTGFYYTRIAYRIDIRSIGSNVTGAMNVSRLAGKKGFIITFLGDALKGALVVWGSRALEMGQWITLISIVAVMIGHIFPIQLKFQGGKGLSTIFGAYLTYNPLWIFFIGVLCIILYPRIRSYTLSCILGITLLPIVLLTMGEDWRVSSILLFCAMIILYACMENIKEYMSSRVSKE